MLCRRVSNAALAVHPRVSGNSGAVHFEMVKGDFVFEWTRMNLGATPSRMADMGQPVELLEHERVLRDGIRDHLDVIKRRIKSHDVSGDLRELIAEMGALAHELHESLRQRDSELEPRHHKYMVRNRGMQPRNPRFYEHVHPVEDLLKFIQDRDANVDPADQTIGVEFTFSVFSRRWGHDDTYQITRTAEGWEIHHMSIGGPCNKRGEPALYSNFRQDSINYPEALPGYLEYLWDEASDDGSGLSAEEVQAALDALAAWVSVTEKESPGGLFRAYK